MRKMLIGNQGLICKRLRKMKKFWSIFTVALVALSAVSCSNNFEEQAVVNSNEALSFNVNIDTRTALEQGENGWSTVWVGNETVVVSDGQVSYNFSNTAENKNTFTCVADGVLSLVGKSVEVVYNPVINSAAGAAGMTLAGAAEAFSAESAIELSAGNAFVKLTSASDVTLTASADIFGNGASRQNSVTVKGENVLVPVYAAADVAFSASFAGVVAKQATLTFVNNKIYNLGTLVAAPVASEYGIVGSFQKGTTWDVANPVKMYTTEQNGWVVARGVELYKDDEFKIVKGNSWDVSYGPKDAAQVLAVDTEHTLTQGGQNVKAAKNGKFDIYFNATGAKFKYECVEEYTGLMVNITVNNKANWSPLSIILKDGDNLLTAAEGDVVTNNTYALSADYIGSSLSYQFVSGTKKSDPAFVTITRNGTTVTLEEAEVVVKLKFQLNTANAKQWWGTTSKIHVWNTGTSFDTSWPGTTMVSEGNYTWSVTVPSELVGKTINYLIHNGNGWQSKDSKITIQAGDNVVTGSSIGVN